MVCDLNLDGTNLLISTDSQRNYNPKFFTTLMTNLLIYELTTGRIMQDKDR